MNYFTTLKTLAVCFAATVLVPATALACPTCKDSLGGDPAASGMVQGYFWSIVFMMSMPFLILGGISAYFYYEICRARQLRAQADAPAAETPATVTQQPATTEPAITQPAVRYATDDRTHIGLRHQAGRDSALRCAAGGLPLDVDPHQR